MKFCDWDWRPAVSFTPEVAFAVLKPNGLWVAVDAWDVFETSAVMSEADWRTRFEDEFGALDLSKIPDQLPPGIATE